MRTHSSPDARRSTRRLVAVLAGLALLAAACSGSSESSEGISTNDGGIAVKPPDVLDGETEVVDGQDTAPVPTLVEETEPDSEPPEESAEGLPLAPDTAFAWFDGSESSIAQLQGKPTVLNFWASTCAACIAEMPHFETVFQDLGDEVAFVGMNTSDRREAADRLANQTGVTYPLAADPDGEVFRSFQLFVMPTTILLTADGEVGRVWQGVLTDKELRILIDEHIAPGRTKMLDVELAFPFTLGVGRRIQPCGFAMLPVYVSFFLGKNNEDETSVARSLLRALRVGAALTAGFVVVFGLFGVLTASLLSSGSVTEYSPYVTLVLGVLLVPMGIAMLFFGFEPKLAIPRLELGGDSSEMLSMFLFGISYAVVSLGCTIGLFIAGVSNVFTNDGFGEGVAVFLAYGLGMGAVIMTLTIAMALARNSIANNMRRVLPWVNRISGVLLVLSGIYLVIYGWWEIQVLRGNIAENALVTFFTDFQVEVNIWIDEVGAPRLGVALLFIIAAALIRSLWDGMGETARYSSLGALGAAWIGWEFIKPWNDERANLFVLPIVRTIIDLPERFVNWWSTVIDFVPYAARRLPEIVVYLVQRFIDLFQWLVSLISGYDHVGTSWTPSGEVNPWRWAVLGEMIALAIVAATVWFRVRRHLAEREIEAEDPAPESVPAG